MSDNKNEEKPAVTERDLEILVAAIRCMEGGLPKPDMQKFADMAGFKNTNSASVSLNSVKKKLMGDAPGKTPKKATPSGKRKQATPKDAGEEDMDGTPSKKMKPTPKKGGKKEAAVKDESDEEDSITALV